MTLHAVISVFIFPPSQINPTFEDVSSVLRYIDEIEVLLDNQKSEPWVFEVGVKTKPYT